MRRMLSTTVALAHAYLANGGAMAAGITDPVRREKTLADARFLVERFGNALIDNKSPAWLEHRAQQRRRARQTHPGKRGGR